jgi:hypothetical protein
LKESGKGEIQLMHEFIFEHLSLDFITLLYTSFIHHTRYMYIHQPRHLLIVKTNNEVVRNLLVKDMFDHLHPFSITDIIYWKIQSAGCVQENPARENTDSGALGVCAASHCRECASAKCVELAEIACVWYVLCT